MRVIITTAPEQAAEYTAKVARQLALGFTSGHVDVEHHWTTEEEEG